MSESPHKAVRVAGMLTHIVLHKTVLGLEKIHDTMKQNNDQR
jgi:hypothetical protein